MQIPNPERTRSSLCGALIAVCLCSSAARAQVQCGDCNEDTAAATILDALTAAQIAVSLAVPTPGQDCGCDVDGSGDISVLDALGMAQGAAGLPFAPACPAFPCPPTGGGATWEQAGYAAGGLFPVITVDPGNPQVVYVCSDVSGVYRSDDRADTWQPMSSGLESLAIATFLVDPSNSNRLWAGTPLGLHRSDNRGASWSLVAPNLKFFVLGVFQGIAVSQDGQTIVVASHDLPPGGEWSGTWRDTTLTASLHRSTDGGATWSQVTTLPAYPVGTRFTSVVMDPHVPGQVFLAVSEEAVLRSVDGGATWADFSAGLPAGLPDHGLRHMAIGTSTIYMSATTAWAPTPTSPPRIFRSPKAAPAWTSIVTGLPTEDPAVISQIANPIRVSQQDETHVFLAYAGWPSLFWRSTDSGSTWTGTPMTPGTTYIFDPAHSPFWATGEPFQDTVSLAVDPTDESRLYASSWLGVWRSDDGGATWVEKVVGTQNTFCRDLLATGGRMFSAHMDTFVFTSTSPTTTWTQSLPSTPGSNFAHAWSLESGDSGKVYAGLSVTGQAPRIYRTDNGGATWIDTSPPFVSSGDEVTDVFTEVDLAADPSTPGRVYVANMWRDEGVYRSNDSGASWTRLPSQPISGFSMEPYIVESIAVDPQDPNRLLAGTFWDGLWYSSNAGVSWQFAQRGGIDLDGIRTLELLALPGGVVFAATDEGVLRSLDGGMSYSTVVGPPPGLNEEFTCLAANPTDPTEVFAGTATQYPVYHNIGSVRHSTDGGATWTNITDDLTFRRVLTLEVDGGYLYAGTGGANVYRRSIP